MKISYLIFGGLFSFVLIAGSMYLVSSDYFRGKPMRTDSVQRAVTGEVKPDFITPMQSYDDPTQNIELLCNKRWKMNKKMVGYCIISLEKKNR